MADVSNTTIPERYTAVEAEYFATRHYAAFFDLSHFGKLRIAGKDALDLMNRISTNDLNGLRPGMGKQTFLATEKGRVVDLCTVYVQQEKLLLLTSPSNSSNVKKWIEKFIISDDVTVEDITEPSPAFFVAGSSAAEFLKQIAHSSHKTLLDLNKMPRHNFIRTFLGADEVLLARANMVMNDGFIIFPDEKDGTAIWNLLLDHSKTFGTVPAGLETFEILRIENGTPIYPYELNENVNPWEVNGAYGATISDRKGCYVGQEVIARLQTYEKVRRRLVGLSSSSPKGIHSERIPRGSKIYDPKQPNGGIETEIGSVTSSAKSPGLNKEIALAYISMQQVVPGAKYAVKVGGKNIDAELSALPFLA